MTRISGGSRYYISRSAQINILYTILRISISTFFFRFVLQYNCNIDKEGSFIIVRDLKKR